jgi:hypothetical protein
MPCVRHTDIVEDRNLEDKNLGRFPVIWSSLSGIMQFGQLFRTLLMRNEHALTDMIH